jgi:hypothetical protein
MTDEPSDPPSPIGGTGSDEVKVDNKRQVSGWIRDLTALVGLSAVLITSWVSVRGLVDKARADQRTADIMLEDEKVKLEIAKEQTAEHEQDLDLQKQLHNVDLERQKELAQSQDAKEKDQRLADVITRVFTDKESSAGDMSILFDFLNKDPRSQPIIENAVLARLENPRSKEEVDIGFRLLEGIGPASFSFVADANRSARLRYDDLFFERYASALAEIRDKTEKAGGKIGGIFMDPQGMVVEGDSLDPEYDFAMFDKRAREHGVPQISQPLPSGGQELALRQNLAAAVILRSNLTIRNCFSTPGCHMPSDLDLTETYLERDIAEGLPKSAIISDAYLSKVSELEFSNVFANQSHGHWDGSKPPDIIAMDKACTPNPWAATGCRFNTSLFHR